jgi:hypothetical protein
MESVSIDVGFRLYIRSFGISSVQVITHPFPTVMGKGSAIPSETFINDQYKTVPKTIIKKNFHSR